MSQYLKPDPITCMPGNAFARELSGDDDFPDYEIHKDGSVHFNPMFWYGYEGKTVQGREWLSMITTRLTIEEAIELARPPATFNLFDGFGERPLVVDDWENYVRYELDPVWLGPLNKKKK